MISSTRNEQNNAKLMPFEELGFAFADAAEPAHFSSHVLRYRNDRAAQTVNLDCLSDEDWVIRFGMFQPFPNNIKIPLAIRYHGHQFRQYNPELGDGRGFLFAQVRDKTGRLLDLGTKGSGQTPYSRFGDGRLTLKGGVREVLATEMLEASGVYTSKTLSLIETGEELHRNDEPSPTRSSVMVRLSHSHIRFGAFQRLAYLQQTDNLDKLIRHVRQYYYSDIPDADIDLLAPKVFDRIVQATARMVASWMAAGFVHGVMNTDNMNVTGETFDFGPYRFLPVSNPSFTAAYFDQNGLYAFGRQPEAALWNLQQLGGTFALVCPTEALSEALSAYSDAYQTALRAEMFAQLGLKPDVLRDDLAFLQSLFNWMTASQIPWHQFFFDWFGGIESQNRAKASPVAELYEHEDFLPIEQALTSRSPDRPERLNHPYFSQEKPATLLIDEIETLWERIAKEDDWSLFHAKLEDIERKRLAMFG